MARMRKALFAFSWMTTGTDASSSDGRCFFKWSVGHRGNHAARMRRGLDKSSFCMIPFQYPPAATPIAAFLKRRIPARPPQSPFVQWIFRARRRRYAPARARGARTFIARIPQQKKSRARPFRAELQSPRRRQVEQRMRFPEFDENHRIVTRGFLRRPENGLGVAGVNENAKRAIDAVKV